MFCKNCGSSINKDSDFCPTCGKTIEKKANSAKATPAKTANAGTKSKTVAILLSFFLGGLGIDRFYLGYTGLGVLKLLTGGVFGILALIDFIRIIIGSLKPKDGSDWAE